MNKSLHLILKIIIWTATLVVAGMIYYTGHHFPHGKSYPTDMNTCDLSEHGPCEQIYQEDLSNIPSWARFFKKSESELLLMGLLFSGIVISVRKQ